MKQLAFVVVDRKSVFQFVGIEVEGAILFLVYFPLFCLVQVFTPAGWHIPHKVNAVAFLELGSDVWCKHSVHSLGR